MAQQPLKHNCKKADFLNLLEKNIESLRFLSAKTKGKSKVVAEKMNNLVLKRNQNICSCIKEHNEILKKKILSKFAVKVAQAKLRFPAAPTVLKTSTNQAPLGKPLEKTLCPSPNETVASPQNKPDGKSKTLATQSPNKKLSHCPSEKPYPRNVSGAPCPQKGCNCRLFTVFEYYSHIEQAHGVRKLKCPVSDCDEYFGDFLLQELHKHAAHCHPELSQNERKCAECSHVASSLLVMMYHQFEHHTPGEWWCRKGCGFFAKLRRDWIFHEKRPCRPFKPLSYYPILLL